MTMVVVIADTGLFNGTLNNITKVVKINRLTFLLILLLSQNNFARHFHFDKKIL